MTTERDRHRYWLVHMMRTGGSTFTWQCKANFGSHASYPSGHDRQMENPHVAVTSVAHITGLDPARLAELRCVTGHFPYFVIDLMPYEYVTMTRLRHPLTRVWSFVKMWQNVVGRLNGASFETIYHDAECQARYRNHMCKMLSLQPDDGFDDYIADIEITDDRLALAKERLAGIDVVGFQEDEPAFFEQLERRYGWRFIDPPRLQATADLDIPESFRQRILDDNRQDLELYEFALELARIRA